MSRHLYMDYGWNQKALQRLEFTLDEHCSLIGLLLTHNLLLFGSDILQCNIAAASTSTKPESSDSSDSLFKLSHLKSLVSPLRDLLHLFFPSDSSLEVMAGIWLGVPEKCFGFNLTDTVFKVRSV